MTQNYCSGLIIIAYYGLAQELRQRNNAHTELMFNIQETISAVRFTKNISNVKTFQLQSTCIKTCPLGLARGLEESAGCQIVIILKLKKNDFLF